MGSLYRSDIASSMSALKTALIIDDAAYLRAFCWIHLADYVMFDYELPEKCDEEDTWWEERLFVLGWIGVWVTRLDSEQMPHRHWRGENGAVRTTHKNR